MTIKNEVLIRVYIVLFAIVVAAVVIFGKAVKISILEGDAWRKRGVSLYRKYVKIEAPRGNILTQDGSLLATSLPFFDIGFDPNSSGMDPKDWDANIDSLSYCLATKVDPTFTPGGYKYFLEQKRQDSVQYISIKKGATLGEVETISQFPLFNLGQFKGGLIVRRKYKREQPFRILANRTIGYVKGDSINVGLEGHFDDVLAGESGLQLMTRVGNNVWIPVHDLAAIEPTTGKDIVTTIDVNLQDITENALAKAMFKHKPKWGVAIVMEVETGAIRAIANLSWWEKGQLWETYNNAVGTATEPGSTFKLASIMALLEDGLVDLTDSIDLEKGKTQFYEETLEDASYHTLDTTTVQKAFEISSNVGLAKLVQENYGRTNKADKFISRLKSFHLDIPTGIEINGEANPYIKEAYSKEQKWSGTTLPWMAIGYETLLTPLQLLTFYNAVANDGKMMKPYLVSGIQQYGVFSKKFVPIQIKRRIASKKTIQKAKTLLEAVVERGTASKYKTEKYRFAGKTGTVQLGYQKLKNRTLVEGYQASFVGYFPAEKPKYSCIVVISEPAKGGIYGGQVALPVFRAISDRIMATEIDLYPALNDKPKPVLAKNKLPDFDAGNRQDLQTALSYLNLPFENKTAQDWAVIRTSANTDTLQLLRRSIRENKVPSVVGMGLRDALYILENMGLDVEIRGFGKVKQQSILPGTRANGQKIRLRLG